MPSADLTRILQVISLAGAGILAYRLYITGLWRQYPVFFWYFVFRIPNTLWPLVIHNGHPLYEDIWIITEPISWAFHVLIVVELCKLVLTRLPGIYSLLRWAMYGSVALAITISIMSLLPKIKPKMNINTKVLGYWFATQRGIDFSLGIFLLLILFFLSRFPVRLNRNILVHSALFTLFFFSGALTMFLHTFFGGGVNIRSTNLVLEVVTPACILAWIVFLTPKGEEVKASFPTISPHYEQHALQQLESLNATLLKVSGK